MKYLYHINKWLVITNVLLFIIPYLGLMFLIVLGAIQLLMYVIIAFNYNHLRTNGKTQFIIYSLLTGLILGLTLFSFNDKLYFNDTTFIAVLVTSITLAFLHLNITYLLSKNNSHETK